MNELQKIWESEDAPGCIGCSVLKQNKPFHSSLDFDALAEADVAFISDSIKPNKFGQSSAFQSNTAKVILSAIRNYSNYSTEFIPSVRCPNVKEADMTAKDMSLCRDYLYKSLSLVKPKLTFVCGNLAMRMLLKKSGITNKRGSLFPVTLPDGTTTIVAPIYSPTMVMLYPEHKDMFVQDINRAYDRVMLGKVNKLDLKYKIIRYIYNPENIASLCSYKWLETTDKKISIDLECTGLNFLTDDVLTIGICWGDKSIIIPFSHKEADWSDSALEHIVSFLENVMANPNNKKIFHNAKFDLKFLLKIGVKNFRGVQCTKLKYHTVISETDPKDLGSLVKKYFPHSLDNF